MKFTNMLIVGHMYAVEFNRNSFDYLTEAADTEILYPKQWTGAFGESYSDDAGFSLMKIPFLPNSYIPFLPERQDIDVLWIDEEPVYPQTRFILNRYSQARLKIIRTAQNIEKHGFYRDAMYSFVNDRADIITAVGRQSSDTARSIFNREIPVIPLSISNDFFRKHAPRDTELTIGFAGRLSEDKGVLIIEDILQHLDFEFKFKFAGAGNLKNHLTQFCIKNNIEHQYMGLVPHNDMPSFYSSIDVLLNPSIASSHWKEQQGRSVIEAAASGVFVISSNSGELVNMEKVCGAIIEPGDTEGFVEELRRINSDNAYYEDTVTETRAEAGAFSHMSVGRKIHSMIEDYEPSGN
ncbi:MAG: glycosyltransferase family 4 protein [bacterium]